MNPKHYQSRIDSNVDIWGSKSILLGARPHIHLELYSLVKDLRAGVDVESSVIGKRVSVKKLDLLRSLFGSNLLSGLHLKSRVCEWNVKYHFIDQDLCGANVAYAKLFARLEYGYRSVVIDLYKYLSQAITSKENPIDFNYPWLGYALNFYGGKSRGDKRFKKIQRFGALADCVQKRNGNFVAHQFKRACAHSDHRDCNKTEDEFGKVVRCPNENFKSPSEGSYDSRKPRCIFHRFSVGEWVTSAYGLPLEECLKQHPKARIVGKMRERRVGSFWDKPVGVVS
ncbi:MAG: hypothetical protein ACHQ1H_03915 [Nitrososphaerales archaeon]